MRGQGGCEPRIEVIVKMQRLVARLGVGGDVGYGGCKPRIEGIVQCTSKVLYIIQNN